MQFRKTKKENKIHKSRTKNRIRRSDKTLETIGDEGPFFKQPTYCKASVKYSKYEFL